VVWIGRKGEQTVSDFIDIPESDFRSSTPDIKPVDVVLRYDNPKAKTHKSQFGSGSYEKFYYAVLFNGEEKVIGATSALHKAIEATGAVQNTEIRIIKRRIGDDAKDIRWTVEHISGPVDTNKTTASQQPQKQSTTASQTAKPTPNKPPNVYEPLTDTALAIWELNQEDEAALFEISLTQALMLYRKVWPEPEEIDPKVLQACAASLFIQGSRTVGGSRGLMSLELPPEPDPIIDIVQSIDYQQLPDSFYNVLIANSTYYSESDGIVEVMKSLGMTGIPKGFHNQYETVRDLLRYAEFIEEGMEESDAIDAVIEAQENEPAF